MNIHVQKKILKDLAAIPKKEREKIEQFVFEESKLFQASEITGIFDKLRGYRSFIYTKRFQFRITFKNSYLYYIPSG